VRNTGVKGWRTQASERTELETVVREAKTEIKRVAELKKKQNIYELRIKI
jgi:hypothetical protein